MRQIMMMTSAFLVGTLLCIGQHALAAERRCLAFSTSGWDDEPGYANCAQCLRQNQHCEKRCFDTSFTCTVAGYDQYGLHTTIQGPRKKKEHRAEKKALRQCRQQGLTACSLVLCTEEKVVQSGDVKACRSHSTGYRADNNNRGKSRESEYRCGIFPKSHQAPHREFPSCNACVQQYGQCEERCAESGYICTATGYNRYGFQETIQGQLTKNQQKAERKAMRTCYDAGLNGCVIEQCSETMRFDQSRVTPCKNQATKRTRRNNKKARFRQTHKIQPGTAY